MSQGFNPLGAAPVSPPFDYDRWRAERDQELEREELRASMYKEPEPTPFDLMLKELQDDEDDDDEDLQAEAEDADSDEGEGGRPSLPPSSPSVSTDEDEAEAAQAVERLKVYDPADAPKLDEIIANGASDDEKALAELRLQLMAERGEFAAQYSRDLQAEYESGNDELLLLDNDITIERSLRRRRELEHQWVALSKRLPRIKTELDRREMDASRVQNLRATAEEDAKQQIMDARKAKLTAARGELSPADQLAGKERPRKQSPATIEKLAWELEQDIPQKDLNELAEKLYTQRVAESNQRAALRLYKNKDTASQYHRITQFYLPTGRVK